jgi:hypothetical protein
MNAELIHRAAGQDYEFVRADEIVGRLVWIERPDAKDCVPGWVLRVPGWPDRQMYRIPQALADDLAAARHYRESVTLGMAHAIVDDRLSGLVPKPVP